MKIKRRKTTVVMVGDVPVGGNFPIAIQSMAKTKTSDAKSTICQINRLEKAGCEIVRVAVPDINSAIMIKEIKKHTHIPIVADIHFNCKLAEAAINSGADKIRLNPGNIRDKKGIISVINLAKDKGVAIRIGTNAGSVIRNKKNIDDSLVSGVLEHLRILEKNKFYNTIISVKASDVLTTISAYRKISKFLDYPLHIGLTATGTISSGAIKSAVALGTLLSEGIGDTIRVSLSADPQEEVSAAKNILSALNLRKFGPEVISCPTCGRCQVDLIKIVNQVEQKLNSADCQRLTVNSQPIKVAIMGCVVNGPQEARDADFGIACGKGCGIIFKKGSIVKKVSEKALVSALFEVIKNARK